MKRQIIVLSGEPQRAHLIRFISGLSLDKTIQVTIEPHQKRRSLSQNALYWKWINEVAEKIADYSGHSPEEVHEFLKHRFLTPKPVTIGGVEHLQYTTRKLTVQEMSAYMDQIYQFVVGELGLYVTLPEERFAA